MELNAEQRHAVECNDKHILCLAGAGTGKTASLIARISRLVKENDTRGDHILALTFTNAAAAEMTRRFSDAMPLCASKPMFKTFHAFCYHLILTDSDVRHEIGYERVPEVCEPDKIDQIINMLRTKLSIKISARIIMDKDKATPTTQWAFDLFHKAFKQTLIKENLISFDQMSNWITELFVADAPCIKKYKSQFKHILVDEFQDTDPLQWKFVQTFKDANLFIVGDALQSLYSFRNADATIIQNLANDENWTTIKLFKNYRSTSQICSFANKMSRYADGSYRIEIESAVAGPDVVVESEMPITKLQPVSPEMVDDIVSELPKLSGSVAILCRTNREVDTVVHELNARDIVCKSGSTNKKALDIFQSGRDNEYFEMKLTSMLSAEQYANYVRYATVNSINDVSTKIHVIHDNFATATIREFYSKVIQLRRIINSAQNLFSASVSILETLGLPIFSDFAGQSKDELIEYIYAKIQSDAVDQLYVGTIHSSKGLEYDNVMLTNVGGPTFPLNNIDNLNCYYVGITRARRFLKIYRPPISESFTLYIK